MSLSNEVTLNPMLGTGSTQKDMPEKFFNWDQHNPPPPNFFAIYTQPSSGAKSIKVPLSLLTQSILCVCEQGKLWRDCASSEHLMLAYALERLLNRLMIEMPLSDSYILHFSFSSVCH